MKKIECKKETKEEKETYQHIPKAREKINFFDVYEGW
jgi:hypothetical protein